ncbi:MAG: hypothetical protein IVW36_11720 [Dehalococcoidia bacterium]|nr:hypothetical protein [Dehalococcoidia bacterium]
MARRTFWNREEERPVVDEGGVPASSRAHDDRRVVRDEREPSVGHRYDDAGYVDEPLAQESVVERRQTSVYTRSLRSTITGLIGLALLVLEVLLAVRFALVAFAANPNGSFTNFILDISSPVVRPFRDTFALRTWDRGVLDYNILLAMGVWFIAGVLLIMVVNAIVPDTSDRYRVDRRRRMTHG